VQGRGRVQPFAQPQLILFAPRGPYLSSHVAPATRSMQHALRQLPNPSSMRCSKRPTSQAAGTPPLNHSHTSKKSTVFRPCCNYCRLLAAQQPRYVGGPSSPATHARSLHRCCCRQVELLWSYPVVVSEFTSSE
jgi:hypothetical protein